MAKVFIEETTLTAIGDAIRGKEGTTELVPVNDMATRITDLPSGGGGNEPTDEELTVTGNCSYRFSYDGWNWFIDKYGNRITTKDISNCSYMFNTIKNTEIPFDINIKDCQNFNCMFAYSSELTTMPNIRGTIKWAFGPNYFDTMFSTNTNVRSLENVFTPEMLDGFSEAKVTSSYSCFRPCNFVSARSLRQLPSWWYKFKLNPESTAFPAYSYTIYYSMLSNCYMLDEITNIPVWTCTAAQTSNMFNSAFKDTHRLKKITFETNEDGSPTEVNWKSQVVDLSSYVGYYYTSHSASELATKEFVRQSFVNSTCYNSGITEDKLIYNDETYQRLKDDPDSFAIDAGSSTLYGLYSRYNKASALATINSLPDTSAYLATAGGTNTIKFKGKSGSLTDSGAINTMTEEEIAVATAKGWTVTFS